jgi:tetratricopeptide (TPR) repeat protein
MTVGVPAAAGGAGLPPATGRRLLDELTEAHLLVELPDGRFTFHDLLRAYAGELARSLDPPPGLRRATRRLLAHYLHTAYRADHLLNPLRDRISVPPPGPDVTVARPEDHEAALAWFRVEHAALLSVLNDATDADLADHVWRLANSIANFLERQGHWTDLVATQTLALETARRLGDWTAQARSHRALGRVYSRLARHDEAHQHLQRGLDLYTRIGDVTGQAYTYLNISVVLGEQRRHSEALRDGHRAYELFVRADHRVGQALTLNTIGWCEAQLRDYRQALEHCQQALALHREVGDRTGEADTWDSLAFAHLGLGDHEQATASYRRALDLFREFGDRFNEAVTLEGLGRVHVATGDLPAAARAWRRALAILDDLGHPEADRIRSDLGKLTRPG